MHIVIGAMSQRLALGTYELLTEKRGSIRATSTISSGISLSTPPRPCRGATSSRPLTRTFGGDTLDPRPFFAKYGENMWAPVKGYLDAVSNAAAAAPAVDRYTGLPAAVDVFTASTAFWVMESLGLDFESMNRSGGCPG